MVRVLGAIALLFVFALSVIGCGGSGNGSDYTGGLTGTPAITSLSATSVAPGGTLTIQGTNLNGISTTVYFLQTGSTPFQATANSGNSFTVTVTVPSTLPAGTYSVYVITNDTSGDYSTKSNIETLTVS